jgi:hypothetical protein
MIKRKRVRHLLWGKDPNRRTKFGRLLDVHEVYQNQFAEASGLSQSVVSKLCNDRSYKPRLNQMVLIRMGLEKLKISCKSFDELW